MPTTRSRSNYHPPHHLSSRAWRWLPIVVWGVATSLPGGAVAQEPDLAALSRSYQADILPLIARYCHACHAGDRTEAEIDLESFATIAAVQRQPKIWQRVRRMLDSRQMPPKDARQPTDAERTRVRKWVRQYLVHESQARAGDPGPVVLRRLTNAEYTYTVRDLTGVSTLDPTHEFPVDGAAGEGVTNAGGRTRHVARARAEVLTGRQTSR